MVPLVPLRWTPEQLITGADTKIELLLGDDHHPIVG
jgi:hypothetical protein